MPPTLAAAEVTNTYRAGLIALRAGLLAHLSALWRIHVKSDDIRGGLDGFIPPAVVLTTAAQHQAAAAGPRYVAGYVAAAIGRHVAPQSVDLAPFVGRVADGRALGEVLPFLAGAVLGQIAGGATAPAALDSGLYAAGRLCGSETIRASRDGLTSALVAEPRTNGRYRRALSARPCPRCIEWAARGAVFDAETAEFSEHAHCSCTAEPAVEDTPDRFPRSIPNTDAEA